MSFRKAERKKAKLRLGICGPAGSGKTYTALLVALGLGGKIALIDTEHGSGELYAHLGDYDVAILHPPFTPERYIELMDKAELEGYSTIILDSISHAWAGEGGLLDMHDKFTKTSSNSYTAWRNVTPKHNAFVEAILQSKCHVIATMRTKTEYILKENDKGKMAPQKVGMAPIQREGMDFEFTTVFDLSLDHLATTSKDRTTLFNDIPFTPSSKTGELLLDWLNTGNEPDKTDKEIFQNLLTEISKTKNLNELRKWRKANKEKIDNLQEHWKNMFNGELGKRKDFFENDIPL